MANEHLENAIIEYIANNPECDSVDIVSHFKLRNDIILTVVDKLIDKKIIERRHIFGSKYEYFIRRLDT